KEREGVRRPHVSKGSASHPLCVEPSETRPSPSIPSPSGEAPRFRHAVTKPPRRLSRHILILTTAKQRRVFEHITVRQALPQCEGASPELPLALASGQCRLARTCPL